MREGAIPKGENNHDMLIVTLTNNPFGDVLFCALRNRDWLVRRNVGRSNWNSKI